MYFRTEGIVLNHRNFGEADRLLTIYTKDYGKVSAIAKGVRRPRSKKAGHLELGNWCELFIAQGKNINLITEAQLKKSFGIANFSEGKANKIYHLLEIIDVLTPEQQKNSQLFHLLASFLSKAENQDFDLTSVVFKVKTLSLLGFFSANSLKPSNTKDILQIFEKEEFEKIKEKITLSKTSYLKLLSFLDSMIESIIERELKTKKFLNGEIK